MEVEGQAVSFLLLWCVTVPSPVKADHPQTHVTAEAGVHCGNVTIRSDQQVTKYEIGDDLFRCVSCLLPQNCLSNNTCRLGTMGSMCEQCAEHDQPQYRYHRVGSMCTPCPIIPWPAIGFCVYILLFLFMTVFMGLNETVCTKMKLLAHFLQHLLLTLHTKVNWPDAIVKFVAIVNFGSFNTNIIFPVCLLHSWPVMSEHYLEWLSSYCFTTVVLVFAYFLDKSMKKIGKERKSDDSWQKIPRRTTLCRLVFFIIMVMYMPSAVSCIRTFQCSNTVPKELVLDRSKNIFLLNNDVVCETMTFQVFHSVGILYLVFMIVLCPFAIIFFTLRQRKWDLLYTQWTLYGPVYEAYKDRFCFWESVILLRKLVAVLITEAFPFSPELQVTVQLGMSATYLFFIVVLRPYKPAYLGHPLLNVNIVFEMISTMVIIWAQVVALYIVQDRYQAIYSMVLNIAVVVCLVLWLVMILAMAKEQREEVNITQVVPFYQEQPSVEEEIKQPSFLALCCSGKARQAQQENQFKEKVNKNKDKINF